MESLADFLARQDAGILDASKQDAGIFNASKSKSASILDASKSKSASILDASKSLAGIPDASVQAFASIKDANEMPANASNRGVAGGRARVASMTASERSELAKRAARSRWKKSRRIGFRSVDGMPD